MVLRDESFFIDTKPNQLIIALAGNPNTGKSTVFNALTGLRQHTGNWPGKTVLRAEGYFSHKDREFLLIDLPGTYSLLATSADEQVARDFICFGRPDAIIVVADATCLERNLNLTLQITEISAKIVVCVNLMDEAQRRKIHVDINTLSRELGVPCIPTIARNGTGLDRLKDSVLDIATNRTITSPRRITYEPHIEEAVLQLEKKIRPFLPKWVNHRWIALRLLEGDYNVLDSLSSHLEKRTQKPIVQRKEAVWTH